MLFRRTALAASLVAGAFFAAPGFAAVTLLGTGVLPGTATDQSGLTGLLEDGVTPKNLIGGLGSAITYSGTGDFYYAAPDRGPADGATTYIDRLYRLRIALKPIAAYGTNSFQVTPTVVRTTLLSNTLGENFTGYNLEFDATGSTDSLRFDPESIRTDACGSSVFISDEYGPYIYRFNLNGKRRNRDTVKLPNKFLIDFPAGGANGPTDELSKNASGRQSNRGMEGLAISPDGTRLFGLMQNALIQDGALDASLKRVATNSRLVEINLLSGEIKEYLYLLDSSSNGLNDITAVNDHQFLVIERDGKAGSSAAYKKIALIDISGATDIRDVKSLPVTGAPAGVTPVSKTVLIDLLAPEYGLAGSSFPEKIEGLAFGPDLASGQRLLIVSSDNDFSTVNASKFYAFGIDTADLPGYQPQQIAACTTP